MQRDNCIYNEQRLNEDNQAKEALGFKPPRRKSDEEIDEMLQAREEILKMCNPLLNDAQQVVSTILEKIKKEKSSSTKVRKVFASLVGSKSLEQLKKEKHELKEQEIDLSNEYTQIIKESEKKYGKDELSCHQSFDTSKNIKKEDFQNNIKVECDYEEERLLNLQKQFENNIITEEEISVNDRIELKGLYYIQILKSKIKIELYKEKIRKNKILT